MGQLEEALKVLSAYNKKLEEEAEQRRDNSKLLDVFTWQQQRLLHQAIVNQKVPVFVLCELFGSHIAPILYVLLSHHQSWSAFQ